MKKEDIKQLQEKAKQEGMTTSRYYLQQTKRLLGSEEKNLPLFWNAMMGKRYILPQALYQYYYSQEIIDYVNMEFIIGWMEGVYGYSFTNDEVLNTKYLALCRALVYQKPTYWLEPELGKPMLETTLPEDIELEEFHWQFPAMRIYLPKGLLTINREGVECSLMYMDITRVDKGERVTLPPNLAEEIKKRNSSYWIPTLITPDEQTTMAVTGTLDFDGPECAIGYAVTTPITNTQIKKVYDPSHFHYIPSPTRSDELDDQLTFKMLRLSFNLLMLMGNYPLEVDPSEVIRHPKKEGKRTRAGLYKAKFVGATLIRSKRKHPEAHEPSGKEVTPHWTKGHWRQVVYGKGRLLRRRQWIGMYSTGDVTNLERPKQ